MTREKKLLDIHDWNQMTTILWPCLGTIGEWVLVAYFLSCLFQGAQWLSGRVLDSRPKGRGFEPHRRHCVVSLSKNINPSLVLVQPRETRPFIAERLLMGCKESDQTKNVYFTRSVELYVSKTPLELSEFYRQNNDLCHNKYQCSLTVWL